MTEKASRAPGKIITFYSYKGGTGRSMALANVAWLLASNGREVLMIDWDLEAPGLHRYFHPFLADKDLGASDGVIDFLIDFAVEAATPQTTGEEVASDWFIPFANILRYAASLKYKFPNGGVLDFVPAGRQGASYSTRVNSFNWADFYNRLGGGVFLQAAIERMKAEYDYILIDSRTGVSDTSGICTVQMPDALVVCYTLNNQSIEGAAGVTRSVYESRRTKPPLEIYPVAMRVDPFEKNKLDRRREYAAQFFSDLPAHLQSEARAEYRGQVEFPYLPFYAYEEILAAFGDRRGIVNSILASTERLTGYLTHADPKGVVNQMPELDDAQREHVLARYGDRPSQVLPVLPRLPVIQVKFPNANVARLVAPVPNAPTADIVRALEFKPPGALLLILGGREDLDEPVRSGLHNLVNRGVARAVVDLGALVIDSGTDAGLPALMGQALARSPQRQTNVQHLGVAPRSQVTYPDQSDPTVGTDAVPLEPNHSHYILAASDEWGCETGTLFELVDALRQTPGKPPLPAIALIANGGPIAQDEAVRSVRRGIPLIVIQGSGGLADEISRYTQEKSSKPPSGDLGEIVHDGTISPFPLDGDPDFLAQMIRLIGSPSQVADRGEQIEGRLRDILTLLNSSSAKSQLPVASALHSIPAPPSDFIGRESEIKELVSRLSGSDHVAIGGVFGMGGIGKTAFAVSVARQLVPNYPDAQIFVDLKGDSNTPVEPVDAMRQIILAFEPQRDLQQMSMESVASFYLSVLSGKRALLLLDNVRDVTQVKPLIPPPGCALLLTSRQFFTLPGLVTERLDVMPSDQARALLLELCPRIGDQADEIARLCGYLPLALRIAASSLTENRTLRVEDFLRNLQDRCARPAALKSASDPSLDVEASINASYTLLSSEAQARLRALAVFPASFDAAAAASMWGVEAKEVGLGELVRQSLVEYDEKSGRYSLHDLVAAFGEARLSKEERTTAQLRHAQHYLEVARAANQLYLQGGENILLGLKRFDGEWEHIRTGQAWAVANAEGSAEAQRLCSEYAYAAINCLELRLRPRDRIAWLEPAVTAAHKLGDKQEERYHLGNLGIAYADLGEVRKAIEYYEQALAIARAKRDRQEESAALGNLGNAYADLGEVRKAIEYYEQQLGITREIGDRRGEGNAINGLGSAYYALGEVGKAIEHYEQALAIARATLAPAVPTTPQVTSGVRGRAGVGDRRGEGNLLGNLGIAYWQLGEVRKAIEYHEQALAIHRETGDQRAEGAALGNLGVAYADLGEVRKAIEYFERALAIARENGDRRGEGIDLFNLCIAHEKLGDLPRALQCAQDALAIFVAIEDPNAEEARKRVEELKGSGKVVK